MIRRVGVAVGMAALWGAISMIEPASFTVMGLALITGAAFAAGRFSFAGGWRAALVEGSTRALRLQILLIAALGCVVMPLVAGVFGFASRGHVSSIGIALIVGAVMFGAGMQVARRCASGALWTAGTGDIGSIFTIAGLFAGATLAAASHATWSRLPVLPSVSLPTELGLPAALALHVVVCGLVFIAARRWERRRLGTIMPLIMPAHAPTGMPLRSIDSNARVWATLALFATIIGFFILTGRPWTVISAFANWGTRLAEIGGADAWTWTFWAPNLDALQTPLLQDPTSVANIGIVLGAACAALALARFRLRLDRGWREVVGGSVGGVAMGFGAVLAAGCNVANLLGAIPSGSLHGWIWLVAAFGGYAAAQVIEVAIRRGFAKNPSPNDRAPYAPVNATR